jgi:hypothetical protein
MIDPDDAAFGIAATGVFHGFEAWKRPVPALPPPEPEVVVELDEDDVPVRRRAS